jgi:hypothetical protein
VKDRRLIARRLGQATTEVVLMFPIFAFFAYAFALLFGMLIIVQKVEIASYYAARRWQLESHRNFEFEQDDSGPLRNDIELQVKAYIGYGTGFGNWVGLSDSCPDGSRVGVAVERTQVWNVVTVIACTKPIEMAWMYKSPGWAFKVTKYVPNRDRPIAFKLPGLQG